MYKYVLSNIYIDLINKLYKQLCIISYIYIYIVYSFFYEDNNRILVIFTMWLRKNDVAKSGKKKRKYYRNKHFRL